MTKDRLRILTQESLYAGFNGLTRLVYRYRRHDGVWSEAIEREVFRRGPAAAVLPYDPARDTVVLIEQFRPGAHLAGRDPWQLEPVAGIHHEGETAEAVARREALEEAGCTLDEMEPVCSYLVSPGCVDEQVVVFCGRTDSNTVAEIAGEPSEHEDIRVHVLPFDEVRDGLATSRFEYALTVIALQWLVLNRDRLRGLWR